jgi:hypothetical protein
MRKADCVFSCALLLSALAAGSAPGQREATYPFTGTWKLNVEKSTFSPGPAPRSTIVTIAGDGTVSSERTDSDGKPTRKSHSSSVGREVTFDGADNLTISTQVSGNILDDTVKLNGKPIQRIHAVFSQNGRIVTLNRDGTDPQGHPVHNREIYERQ